MLEYDLGNLTSASLGSVVLLVSFGGAKAWPRTAVEKFYHSRHSTII